MQFSAIIVSFLLGFTATVLAVPTPQENITEISERQENTTAILERTPQENTTFVSERDSGYYEEVTGQATTLFIPPPPATQLFSSDAPAPTQSTGSGYDSVLKARSAYGSGSTNDNSGYDGDYSGSTDTSGSPMNY